MLRRTFFDRPIPLQVRPSRRQCLAALAALLIPPARQAWPAQNTTNTETRNARAEGLLLGGLLGDALGGPWEFLPHDAPRPGLPAVRSWPGDRRVDPATLDQWAAGLQLQDYRQLRPEPAPYGPWRRSAPAGTVTDDSRHKILLLRTLRKITESPRDPLTERDLAEQFIAFRPHHDAQPSPQIAELLEQGLHEYRLAARWLLGQRDPERALPVERLWAGIPNCSGQMMFPPLAAVYPGRPADAYQATFALDFIDAPYARDLASALVAALAAVLDPQLDSAPIAARWSVFFSTLHDVDPYRIAEVPFAGRPLNRWLDLVDDWVRQADSRPAHLFRLLETHGQPIYWWDAHFTLIVPLAIIKLCQYDPLAALQLTLDFGHDTDSYAQVLGCIAGAVHGSEIFPVAMRDAITGQLQEDFGESISDWNELLAQLALRQQQGDHVVQFLQHASPLQSP